MEPEWFRTMQLSESDDVKVVKTRVVDSPMMESIAHEEAKESLLKPARLIVLESITGIKMETAEHREDLNSFLLEKRRVSCSVNTLDAVSFYELLVKPDIIDKRNIAKVTLVIAENYQADVHSRLFNNPRLLKVFMDTRCEDILLNFLN